MLFLDYKLNKDNFVAEREEVWKELSNILNVKELIQKTDFSLNFNYTIPDVKKGLEISKANDRIDEIISSFFWLQFDLEEMVLSNRLAQNNTDKKSKAYFLINFHYYLINSLARIYTFWNMVAQYLNILDKNPDEIRKINWEKEEEEIDCGKLKKLTIKNSFVQKICDAYSNMSTDIMKLRHQVVHRRKIPILGLGPEYYTRISETMIEFAAQYKTYDPKDLEEKIIGATAKIIDVIIACIDLLESEIKQRGYNHITITKKKEVSS